MIIDGCGWHKDGRCVRVKQLVEKNVLEIKGYKIEVIWTPVGRCSNNSGHSNSPTSKKYKVMQKKQRKRKYSEDSSYQRPMNQLIAQLCLSVFLNPTEEPTQRTET